MKKSIILAFVAIAIFAGFFAVNAEAGAGEYSRIERITNFLAGNGTFSNPNGQILAPAGSATTPSYSFSGNTHQGMFEVTSTRLGFSGGGSVLELDIDNSLRKITAIDAVLIASTGTSPALEVAPSGATAVGIQMRNDNVTKMLTLGTSGNEFIGGYLSGTPTLVVSQNAGASGAVSAALFKGPISFTPNASAVTIANPTDTTTVPANQLCEVCKMTSAANAAWTPAETNAIEGMVLQYINTGANTITMTASAGVYVGTAAVGPNDVVTMTYIGSQWVQTGFMNN